MPVTLQDIAERLGVSVATVSRALSGAGGVSDATRQRVRRIADEMGYHPNVTARRLQKRRTDTIGFVIPTFGPRFSDPFFSELLAGIGNEATRHETDLLVSTRPPGAEEMAAYERIVRGRRADGLLVVRTRRRDPRIRYLLEQRFPFVAFGRVEENEDFPYVDVDGHAGLRILTQHLIDRGHRVIAFVNASPELMFAVHRLAGYREALEANAIPYRPELVEVGALTEYDGYEAGRRLLGRAERPTAIIASNDLMAIGVMRAVREANLHVGEDVAVAGFDDIPLARVVTPALTTVHQPIYEIGRRICAMLLRLLAGETLEEPHVVLTPELVVRQST